MKRWQPSEIFAHITSQTFWSLWRNLILWKFYTRYLIHIFHKLSCAIFQCCFTIAYLREFRKLRHILLILKNERQSKSSLSIVSVNYIWINPSANTLSPSVNTISKLCSITQSLTICDKTLLFSTWKRRS